MLHGGVEILFEDVKLVLAAAITELERNQEKIDNPDPKDDLEQIMVIFVIVMSKNLFIVGTY